VWARSVPLLPNELLSSWLVRAALAQGCDPLVLTGYVWPRWRIWTLDADRTLSDERLLPLCRLSGISSDAFRTALLLPTANRIAGGGLPEHAIWPWILALGTRNTKRRSGLQFCPVCFAETAFPYYRLQSRFAWHTVCEQHGIVLMDRCGNCGAPLEPHRLSAEDRHIAVCASCKADLWSRKQDLCHPEALAFQKAADAVVRDGSGIFLGSSHSSRAWFGLADFFVSIVRRANRRIDGRLTNFIRAMEIPWHPALVESASIELMGVRNRQNILGMVWHFIVADQERLQDALALVGVTRQGFCPKGEPVPALASEIAGFLQDASIVRAKVGQRCKSGPRPRYEVRRMMVRLRRRLEMLLR
jgi:hypothetical protein